MTPQVVQHQNNLRIAFLLLCGEKQFPSDASKGWLADAGADYSDRSGRGQEDKPFILGGASVVRQRKSG
jgi:hypothetical protein